MILISRIIGVTLAVIALMLAIEIAIAAEPEPEALRDSKPEDLFIVDQMYLRPDTISIGMARAKVLVNRVTGKVEYVYHNFYKRYVRPKFAMANVQALYKKTKLREK